MTKRSKIVKEPYFTLITLGIKSEDLLNRRSGGGGNLLYISHFNLHPSLLHPQWTKSLSLRLISSSPLYSSPSPRRRLPPMIPTVIISPLTAGPSSTSLSPLHLRILLRPTRVPTHPIEFTSPPLSYRVLRLNQTDRTMTLARSDLWIGTTRTTYLTEFTNTTLVNSTLLNCSPHNEDLTIFYGSSNFTMKPSNLFNCSINGTSSTAFYLTGPILNIATCSVGVRLKILQTVAHELTSNRITLREALMEGFNVNYGDCGIQPCRTPGIRAFSPVKIAFFAFGCE